MTIRVAAFISTEAVSGPGRQLAAVAESLRALDVLVTVICVVDPGEERTPFTDLLTRHGVSFVRVSTDGRMNATYIRNVDAAIRSIDPDIVQSHSYRPAFVVWLLRMFGVRWRWIGFFHGETQEDFKVRVYNAIDRFLLRRSDHAVVVARAQLGRIGRRREISHIPNAVLGLQSRPEPHFDSSSHGVARIGCVGRLSYEKGIDILLHALTEPPLNSRPFELLIAGDGPALPALRELVSALELTDRVQFVGVVDDMGTFYSSLDVLVLSSRSEGMPNVLLEAAHFDVPMVATRVGDVDAILTDNDAGMVVPPEQPRALAGAIFDALARGRRPEGTAARQRIGDRFSLAARAQAHAALYRRILETAS